jgi:ceramide glucosyltransferase
MLLRRTALRAMGGLRAVRSVLAEDQIIAAKVREAGWEVRLAPEPVHNANRTWSLRCFTERHARWARIRLRLAPWSYPLEIAGNPLAMALVAILLGAPHPLTLLAGTLVAKTTLDALATYALRGEAVPPRYLLLGPIKDLLLIGVWLVPFASRRVRWRGNTLRISRGTRVTTPKVYTRSRAIRWARRRHRALRHIRNHGRHARRVSSSLRSHRRHRRGARWGSAGST